MRKTLLASALAGMLTLPSVAFAQAAEPASPHTLTANVGLYSQYIFRGLTQTNEEPALQGGFDYSHASGFYLGVWGSNVSWLSDPSLAAGATQKYSSGGSLELDFYGGFKKSFGDFAFDVGLLQYWYPGDQISGAIKADTLEMYGAVGWKWFNLKYSYVLSDEAFGVKDASGTQYLDLSASYPLGETGLTLGAHYGWQMYDGVDNRNAVTSAGSIASNDDVYSYDDWRVTVAYDLGKATKLLSGAEVGLMYSDTSGASACGYGSTGDICPINNASGAYPKNIAEDQVTVWFKKTF
jgi:uncharacterized protein (TIGR02001 family)